MSEPDECGVSLTQRCPHCGQSMNTSQRRGNMLRRAIAAAVLPKLAVGELTPSIMQMARALRISEGRACHHLRLTLREHGVATRCVVGKGRVVVSLPESAP